MIASNQIPPGESQLFIERDVLWDGRNHVKTVAPIQPVRAEGLLRNDRHQFIGEEDIDVGREDELPARAPNPDVLGDHLEERQHTTKADENMPFVWYRDHPAVHPGILMVPANNLGERSAVPGRIPFHQNQLGAKLMPPALFQEAVDEDLRPMQRIAAVVIIAARRDQCEVRGFPME